ncbi:pyridoxamine 5'-phosphate oxidase [Thermaurantiacus sp.]
MEDPIARFAAWLADAEASEPNDPNACALATVDQAADGSACPDVRMVLLKGFDDRGFRFFTNLESAKGRQLAAVPHAALCFHWKTRRRQVRVAGPVVPVDPGEADLYFATRPRASQLSAWASAQSRPLALRAIFERELEAMDRRYPGAVPRPPFWSGFRVVPSRIEFWEDRAGRQHHREVAVPGDGGWRWSLLYP